MILLCEISSLVDTRQQTYYLSKNISDNFFLYNYMTTLSWDKLESTY